MESEVFPKIDLFPRTTRAAEAIKTLLRAGHVTETCLTNHNRGASVMLDAALDNQPRLPIDGGWDDMGRYIDSEEY